MTTDSPKGPESEARVWAPVEPTAQSEALAKALRQVGVVDPDDDCMSVFETTGEGIKHWVPVDLVALRLLESAAWSSEVERLTADLAARDGIIHAWTRQDERRRAEVSRLRKQLATAVVLPQDADECVSVVLNAAANRCNAALSEGFDIALTSAVMDLLRSWGASSSEVPQPQGGGLQWQAVHVQPGTSDREDIDARFSAGWWVLGIDPESPEMPNVQMRVEPGPDYDGGEGPVARWIAAQLEKAARQARSITSAVGMTQHRVEITYGHLGYSAHCATCRGWFHFSHEDMAKDWKDQHEADTLRPALEEDESVPTLEELRERQRRYTRDEGRPSGSKAAEPRSGEDLVQRLRSLVADLQGESYDKGFQDGQVQAGNDLEMLLDECAPDAAQAARSEATPKGVRYLSSNCHRCHHTYNWHASTNVCVACGCEGFIDEPVPSPSLRKEGEDRDSDA